MDDRAWAEGMADLLASLPDREADPGMLARRGEVYRRELMPLSNSQWRHAVGEAIRTEQWFPPVAKLLELGYAAMPDPRPPVRGYLPAPTCVLCEGTGFEPFERREPLYGGALTRWVRHCPAGCVPHRPGEPRTRPEPVAEEWRAGR